MGYEVKFVREKMKITLYNDGDVIISVKLFEEDIRRGINDSDIDFLVRLFYDQVDRLGISLDDKEYIKRKVRKVPNLFY